MTINNGGKRAENNVILNPSKPIIPNEPTTPNATTTNAIIAALRLLSKMSIINTVTKPVKAINKLISLFIERAFFNLK